MKRTLRSLALLAIAVSVLAAVLLVRTLSVAQRVVAVPPVEALDLDEFALARRLGRALQVATVSTVEEETFPRAAFDQLERTLEETFARAHGALELEQVGDRARLYTWRGAEPALPPLLLLAHLDVVPVEPATRELWRRPPFSGELAMGCVWGRGALDDKSTAVAILEAVEEELRRGARPRRTVLIAFGYDEEVGGERGAAAVAELLAQRGVAPFLVLDEGLAVLEGFLDGIEAPVAAIGVAEKGFVELELCVEAEGGHSSMPPPSTAVGTLARAVERLERHRLPAALDPPVTFFFERLAPQLPFARRMVLANGWLLGGLVQRELAKEPGTDALLRTTTAVTRVAGGVAANVLPKRATATVLFRVHPRDSVASVVEHARRVIGDPRVQLAVVSSCEPSALAPHTGAAYELLERTILQVFPEALVAPTLCVAATDARHYARLTPNVYRFQPVRLRPADLARYHGVDERIELARYEEMVAFFVRLLRGV